MTNSITLPTDYQSFIHQSRYSRFLDDYGRRETWEETVDRYMTNVVNPVLENSVPFFEARTTTNEIRDAILNLSNALNALHDGSWSWFITSEPRWF